MKRVRKILIATGITVVVLIAGMAIVLSTIDLQQYVSYVETKTREVTGRELKLNGKLGFKLSLLPTIAAEDVSFQNAPWGSRPLLAIAKRAEVQIALLPLLTGKLVIRRVLLVEPDVLLEVDAKGERNWVFAPAEKAAQAPARADEDAGAVELRRIEVRDGLLTYRQAKPRLEHKAKIAWLALDAARGFDALEFDALGALNEVGLALKGRIDGLRRAGEPGATGEITLDAELGGNGLRLTGRVPLATGAAAGLDARFHAELKNVASLRAMLKQPLPPFAAATVKGHASLTKEMLVVEEFESVIGESRIKGSLRLALQGERRAFDVRLEAPLIDLEALRAARKAAAGTGPRKRSDGRIFPDDPFPLEALKALEGEAQVKIEKLRMAGGKVIDDVRLRARFKGGRIDSDEISLRLQGRELKIDLNADASSGKHLAVDASIVGDKVPLAAITGLLGLAPPPEGAPTDIAVKFAGRGGSVRALMASANGSVRIVVGPGRIKNRAIDVGANMTNLLNALNPARSQDPYTQVTCAVLRFPVRNGVAKIDNGLAAETTRVRVIGGGTVNLRNETLELGFRPAAASGISVGAGSLASLAKVEGTLANPSIGLDMASTAGAAAVVGAAVVTGGLSLLAGGLLIDTVPDNPCQVALSGVAPKKKSTVDKVLDPLKKLFGN